MSFELRFLSFCQDSGIFGRNSFGLFCDHSKDVNCGTVVLLEKTKFAKIVLSRKTLIYIYLLSL